MKELKKLIEYIEQEYKDLQTARDKCITHTERLYMEARMVDVNRILNEARKLKGKEENGEGIQSEDNIK